MNGAGCWVLVASVRPPPFAFGEGLGTRTRTLVRRCRVPTLKGGAPVEGRCHSESPPAAEGHEGCGRQQPGGGWFGDVGDPGFGDAVVVAGADYGRTVSRDASPIG